MLNVKRSGHAVQTSVLSLASALLPEQGCKGGVQRYVYVHISASGHDLKNPIDRHVLAQLPQATTPKPNCPLRFRISAGFHVG